MANYLDLASSLVGRREGPDRGAIQEYLRNGGQNLDPATTAWCAAYVNSSLKQAGMPTTGSNMARSFLNYGTAVDTPQRGDIAVFPRGDPNGPYGHVGFVDSVNGGKVRLLAGNQGNSVSYADMDMSQALGFRRPGEAGAQPGVAAAFDTRKPQGTLADALPGATMPEMAAPNLRTPDPLAALGQSFQRRQQADAEAEQKRRQALFGAPPARGGVAGLFA